MHITIPSSLNSLDAIRRCGYGLINSQTNPSFARRLGTGSYPRFHVYIKDRDINLHLDQKQASYEGYGAHSGEYEGEVVEREAERIAGLLEKMAAERDGEPEDVFKSEEKGFWSRLFGNK